MANLITLNNLFVDIDMVFYKGKPVAEMKDCSISNRMNQPPDRFGPHKTVQSDRPEAESPVIPTCYRNCSRQIVTKENGKGSVKDGVFTDTERDILKLVSRKTSCQREYRQGLLKAWG